ncbi:MAG: putative carboxypeptidase [Acidobacteria bacterium OLB17]|nr:MAG: putative carboxypeptidase [Acidobacteria bacterium OLB17]MCZ2391403.1 M14 family metallopeptidase [Acidobacteriota bacterium]
MNNLTRLSVFSVSLLLGISFAVQSSSAQSDMGRVPREWQTVAERTNYDRTGTYAQAVAFAKKLDAASALIKYTTYGKSGEGRDLPLLIAASDGAFTPKLAKEQGKAVVLVQAGIHAGEIDGKDAGFALLRDIAITKTRTKLLDNVVILFQVIYNVDGHENSNPYMRFGQNGPAEMGFRANATNLNLNRDYMKADAPETRGWLKLWNEWKPDVFIDCHVTDGADFQYNITYEYAHFQEIDPKIKDWMDEHFDGRVVPKIEKEGNILTHYVEFAGREITSGIATFIATPRFSTGYTPLRNRVGLLIETHVYKPYRSRVRGTYDTLRYFIEEIGRSKDSLFAVDTMSDMQTIQRGRSYDPKREFPLTLSVTDKPTEMKFKGVEYSVRDSDISGGKMLVYGSTPKEYTIRKFDEGRVETSVAPPLAYIIPPQYKDVIEVLKLHGLRLQTIKKPLTIEVESYHLTEPKWATSSFENRITLRTKPVRYTEKRTYAAGSVIVPMDQEAANVAIHLLEPAGPDSFVLWGFFNSIFELKEFGSGYALEKLAREMLAKDPKLKEEFDRRLLDPNFARNPRARLQFFYERTPYFLNQKQGVYPVGRIITPLK